MLQTRTFLTLAPAFLLIVASCGDDTAPVDPDGGTSVEGGIDAGPNGDNDGDGLTNKQERDGWEIAVDRIGLGNFVTERVTSDPDLADTDGDGLTDQQEFQKTDPNLPDTDGDSLTDADEVNIYLSIPSTVDTDGDSISGATSNPQLWDGEEVTKWGTSPSLDDTDGDNRTDFDEIISNATNPLVAQVPSVDLFFEGTMQVGLDVVYTDAVGVTESYGTAFALENSAEAGRRDSVATTRSVETNTTISASVGSGLPPSASVSVSRSTTNGFSNSTSADVSRSARDTSRREYDREQAESSTRTSMTRSGNLSIGLRIANPSDRPYTLSNLGVTALRWDTAAQTFETVATLEPIFDTLTLAAGAAGEVQQVETEISAELAQSFLREPSALTFSVTRFDIENVDGINFAFLEEVTAARTGRIVIDYGDRELETYRVATNVRRNADGSLAGVPLQAVFDEYLEIPFTTAAWAGNGSPGAPADKEGIEVLTGIRDLSNADGEVGFWALFSDVADIEGTFRNFGETVLQRGESLHLAYLRDRDGDGLYDREEDFYVTDDTVPDTDADMLTDFEEVKEGWLAGMGLVTGGYPKMVFSDPNLTDTDDDGWTDAQERTAGTDPRNPDTDGDLAIDSVDTEPLVNSNEPPDVTLTESVSGPVATLTGSITDASDVIESVTIDWGDGFVQMYGGDLAVVDESHGYLLPGTYTITVTATDARAGVSAPTYMVTTLTPLAAEYFPINPASSAGRTTAIRSGSVDYRDDRFSMANESVRFRTGIDGSEDVAYATLPASQIPMDNFSLSIWIVDRCSGTLLSQDERVAVRCVGGEIHVALGDDASLPVVASTGFALEGMGWKFITVTKAGMNVRIYVNGIMVANQMRNVTSFRSCSGLFLNGEATNSGCNPTMSVSSSNVDTFTTNLIADDIRVFYRGLSASDVMALYLERGYTP